MHPLTHETRWSAEKLRRFIPLLRPLIYRRKQPLADFYWQITDSPSEGEAILQQRAAYQDLAHSPPWQRLAAHSYWGAWNCNFVMQNQFSVPADWSKSEGPIALFLPLGEAGDIFNHPENSLFIDGQFIASADRHHQEVVLPEACLAPERKQCLQLLGWSGLSGWPPDPEAKTQLYLRQAMLVQIDSATRELYTLCTVALEVANALNEHHPAKAQLLNQLNTVYQAIDIEQPESVYRQATALSTQLKNALSQTGEPLTACVTAVGHAHIDIAYLWQINQTRHKARRTFKNALNLIEQNPEYTFSQSMPQLFQFIEQDDPTLFEQIKQAVSDGRFELMGALWAEPDCNLTGAEAMVRQLLLAHQYYEGHFGQSSASPVAWLPDSFGFCASLPQLLKQAGVEWFVTNKLNWNQYNPMPHQVFHWRGLDGSEIKAHLLTTPTNVQHLPFPTTYKAEVNAETINGSWQGLGQKHHIQHAMMAYGYGNGGGGPTQEQIDKAKAFAAVPGLPRVKFGRVIDHLRAVEQDLRDHQSRLPCWEGELYLEGHRGVYTSESRIKKLNRRAEAALHHAEHLASAAHLLCQSEYPQQQFTALWQTLCLNQFHDILPGTSITPVIEQSWADYQQVIEQAHAIARQSVDQLSGSPEAPATTAKASSLWLQNPAGYPVHELLELKAEELSSAWQAALSQQPDSAQQTPDGDWLLATPLLPAYQGLLLESAEQRFVPPPTDTVQLHQAANGDYQLENAFVCATLNGQGQLISLYDKRQRREVLSAGEQGNQLWLFEDRPMSWDAWDIDLYYEDKGERIDQQAVVSALEYGPLRATVELVHRFSNSQITQRISLCHHRAQLDFDTQIDWHERHRLLKVAFPLDVHASHARYDIPWGHIERATHRNTPYDWARFEVPAHKWADLSEPNFGVALLNDCKYGYDIHHNTLRLSLLKSATMPNPEADQGQHQLRYSLLVHHNALEQVHRGAHGLNHGLRAYPITHHHAAKTRLSQTALVHCEAANVVIETLKIAEDGQGLVLRLNDFCRQRQRIRLHFTLPLIKAWRCTLLEKDPIPLPIEPDQSLALTVKPFEIITLRCAF